MLTNDGTFNNEVHDTNKKILSFGLYRNSINVLIAFIIYQTFSINIKHSYYFFNKKPTCSIFSPVVFWVSSIISSWISWTPNSPDSISIPWVGLFWDISSCNSLFSTCLWWLTALSIFNAWFSLELEIETITFRVI